VDEQRDLHPVARLELDQQPGHVRLHGRHAHVQLTTTAGREEVAAVPCDGRDVVLLRPDGGGAARERTWHRAARLRRAFSAEGWPWRDGDPYATEYSRWVEGLPDVGAREEALLRARHAALRAGDAADAGALRRSWGGWAWSSATRDGGSTGAGCTPWATERALRAVRGSAGGTRPAVVGPGSAARPRRRPRLRRRLGPDAERPARPRGGGRGPVRSTS
jgi:hypothetical protein